MLVFQCTSAQTDIVRTLNPRPSSRGRCFACTPLLQDLPLEVKSELKDFQTQDHAFHGQQMGFHNSGALASVRH